MYIYFNKHHKLVKLTTLLVTLLTAGSILTACSLDDNSANSSDSTPVTQTSSSKHGNNTAGTQQSVTKAHQPGNTTSSPKINAQRKDILSKLVSYTNSESAGPNGNYYWLNGKARLTGFSHLGTGNYRFTSDVQGRSATARAILTYSEYQSSKGSRQGSPLDPPAWPTPNPKVAITYQLTGRTYHGYLYNRSHSIADSLLGSKSYTSKYNFTTGTRPQNTGANQNGGMRYAEETAENYWKSHPQTSTSIDYETTPLYVGNETVPRGSIVDIKSSDNTINTEVVVINSVEGIKVNYKTGSSNATPDLNHIPAAVAATPKPSHQPTKASSKTSTHSSSITKAVNGQ
ncbi:prophage Lp1 protein 2 [Lentilactobacillus kosonis]|uniref:Prophage Lp1 protein 2 n=1 Tax=Lentilactobacillus kosonis TaxID=2810561 RepID=A0A401FNK5_9LACO|nr:prophage Lp1 protein 2 [Lentilactobacillus kosonis]